MKNQIIIITVLKAMVCILVFMLFTSCNSDNDPDITQDDTPEPDPIISINSLAPIKGPRGTLVSIIGENYGNSLPAVQVFFNDKEAEVQSVNDSIIVAEVPLSAGSGKVSLIINNSTIEGPEFEYELSVIVETLAGDGTEGLTDGQGAAAKFAFPSGVAIAPDGSIWVCDTNNHLIRRITQDGQVTTIAGSIQGYSDGVGTEARFRFPSAIAFDPIEGHALVADRNNHCIRKITEDGTVTTFAGNRMGSPDYIEGTSEDARFSSPFGLAVGPSCIVYVSDAGNQAIRVITMEGEVSTLAGGSEGNTNGTGSEAQFNLPRQLAVGPEGNIWVADAGNHAIRMITLDGAVTTVAGGNEGYADGNITQALFNFPRGLAFDEAGQLIIVDSGNNIIRILREDDIISTYAGLNGANGFVNGFAEEARFWFPFGIAIDNNGIAYIADAQTHSIRKLTLEEL